MGNKKETYVIGILKKHEDRTEIVYVTGIPAKNYAEWKSGEKAMEFSKEYAKDICLGLCLNGYYATPMLKPEYFDLRNC